MPFRFSDIVNNATRGDITFPVDYNDVGAVNPGASDVFYTQADVDKFLGDNSATNFQGLQECWNALPQFLASNITFNLAAGVHRPVAGGGSSAWGFADKVQLSGTVTVNGAPSSSYDEVAASVAITSANATLRDPNVVVSGTPYTPGALKGLFAVLDTGQVSVIHDNTADTLFLMSQISPASPTAVTIARPSTILRNSTDDATNFTFDCLGSTFVQLNGFLGGLYLNDLRLDAFGGTGVQLNNTVLGYVQGSRIYTDYEIQRVDFGVAPNGRDINQGNATDLISFFEQCSFIADAANVVGRDSPIAVFAGNTCFLRDSYIANSRDACFATGRGAYLAFANIVAENLGDIDRAAFICEQNAQLDFTDFNDLGFSRGKENTYRGAAVNTKPGVLVQTGGSQGRIDLQGLRFEDNYGPCVQFGPGANFSHALSVRGFLDGGGNQDVGIDVLGPGATVTLCPGNNVTGLLGDVRIEGVIDTYANLEADSPLTTTALNRVEKLT